MKTGIIVQARIGSTRLPGKVMKNICGKPIIHHVVDRLKLCRSIDDIIIATTICPQDDVIAEYCENNEIKSFRGSEDDVLSRYFLAAEKNGLDTVVRVTSDCPLIDPFIIDNVVNIFKNGNYDIVTNINNMDVDLRTFPRGLDVEVFSFDILRNANENAIKQYHREHVTLYIYEISKKIYYYKSDINLSKYRWTVDTQDDFKLIDIIYSHLYNGIHNFFTADILRLIEKYPELAEINSHIEQKKI